MNKTSIWACAITNIIITLGWIALAVIFNIWWIALFALLFIAWPKTQSQYYRICDKCNKRSEYADSHNDALKKAIKAGWLHISEGNKDYCPDCKAEFEKYFKEN